MGEPPRLSDLTTAELTERALTYRAMAATATTPEQRASLIRLAQRFERMAAERDEKPAPSALEFPET